VNAPTPGTLHIAAHTTRHMLCSLPFGFLTRRQLISGILQFPCSEPWAGARVAAMAMFAVKGWRSRPQRSLADAPAPTLFGM
jgi:hypothetical protein